MTRAAATYLIIEVATVCEKLHGRVRDHFSEMPWRRIAGMRNIAAHANDEVNDEVAWDVLAVFVPQLARDLGLPPQPGDPMVLPPGLDTA
ncbi:HepT-like ribonuclease domain-containing protein [Promicromonospora sp. NPDC023987]|uniref:HepT-like ribonuclease domain-containing protein n=1 Tax=Promicromonospora sp. NPDC023987 TaxID=3155360 RepID=UPI0033E5940C